MNREIARQNHGTNIAYCVEEAKRLTAVWIHHRIESNKRNSILYTGTLQTERASVSRRRAPISYGGGGGGSVAWVVIWLVLIVK